MYSKTPPSAMKKRPREDLSTERPRKSPFGNVKSENEAFSDPKVFKFRILLPNEMTLELKMTEMRNEMEIEEFIDVVKREYIMEVNQRSKPPKRRINWKYQDLHFTDAYTNNIRLRVNFRIFKPNEWHFLWLHDGSAEPDAYEDMWDLTPDTELLKELPDDYTFETALADLIDNSLQALWFNGVGERKLISLEWRKDRILIFDSGPGMDGADGNLVKWGKMGASSHRSVRGKAIGGKPPYLVPFFGMFGYGGPVAAMCLGRRALVSSKTKKCSKVFTLHLEREALMSASHSENCWKTKGGIRDPLDDEMEKSPHGSFTKVEIFEPKMRTLDLKQFRCKLKDIYFPYIQCDEMSGKTSTPVEFKVNGKDLAGIEGGEVATTNLHSSNGPEFVLQLHFSISQESSSSSSQTQRVFLEANARLKCVYFPIIEGKENIQRIIDKLEEDGYEIRESYEGYSRVSVRRLGRLLPDARWAWLPFMEPKQRKGEKAQVFKRCFSRVKCFIDTDSGFNPTPYKTDLAHHHPYTKALKNFGNKTPENEKDVQIEVLKDGKKLTLSQLEKMYNDWVLEMHKQFDEEIDAGLDKPTLIVVSSKIKKLGTSGPGEARLIIRPFGLSEDKGCHLPVDNGNITIELRESLSFPISVIDSEKCIAVDDSEWENKLEMHRQKLPSGIDLLTDINCQELEIEGGLPTDVVEAGDSPPENIVAVIRPKSFNPKSSYKSLDQRFLVRDYIDMNLEVKFSADDKNVVGKCEHVYTVRIPPSSHKGIHGLYLFPLKVRFPKLFQKAGFYKFSFSLKEYKDVRLERVVQVQASAEVGSWKVVSHKQDAICTVRVGSCFEPICIACYDRYNNNVLFTSVPNLAIKLISSDNTVLAQVNGMRVGVESDKSTMLIKDIIVKTKKLDQIRPNYEATLNISSLDEALSVDFPCQVIPGIPRKIVVNPRGLRKELTPGRIIEELVLEVFDAYGNHVKEDGNIMLHVDGFSLQDGSGVLRDVGIKCVDAKGYVDLSNILKVSKGYGKDVSLCVIDEEKVIFKLRFQTERRELRTVSKVFKNCVAGSQLENIVFEVINPEGEIDKSIHDEEKRGQSHTLTIKSNSFDIDDSVRYSFRHGRCTIRSIPLPQTDGIFSISASHSRYPELNSNIEVHVEKSHEYEDVGTPLFSTPNLSKNLLIPYSNSSEVTEVVNGDFTPKSSKRKIPALLDYSTPKTPKMEHTNARDANSDLWPIQVVDSQNLGNFAGSPLLSRKEVVDDLHDWGMIRVRHQRKLESLNSRRDQIEQNILDLQASIDRNSQSVPTASVKEMTIKQIESKTQSAAAVFCKMHEEVSFEERPKSDIIGIVALLGTVQSIEISRILAMYLGEDQMLAVVCTNYAAAYYLQTNTIPEFAAKLRVSLHGECISFCIEDIRPMSTEPSSNPEELLPLPIPKSPNGDLPQGFLGYAVDMISIEGSHWRTTSGHGLRETLFYRLFGELQVYTDRHSMMMASPCFTGGAVSLDGGIIRGNGVVSFGNWEPDVLFPVKKRSSNPQCLESWELMERNRMELRNINDKIDEEMKSSEIDNKKFQIALDSLLNAFYCYRLRIQLVLVIEVSWNDDVTDIALPLDKLSLNSINKDGLSSSSERKGKVCVVLVSTGSFNPPTYMHLRCFELAKDAVNSQGFYVIGGYMSPVNNSYKKKGLIPVEHRIAMCRFACRSSDFIMASQSTYQRTLTVLSRVRTSLCKSGVIPDELLKVMLVCGSDLLESFGVPGAWIREQVQSICRDFGLVCIRRDGQDVENIISKDDILNEYKNNIKIVDEVVPNGISSTGLRNCISRGLSVKYLTADELPINSRALVVSNLSAHNYVGQNSPFSREDMQNGMHSQHAESTVNRSKKLQDDMQELGKKIKHHEDNLKYLKSLKNKLEESILDLRVSIGKYHTSSSRENEDPTNVESEEETIQKILNCEKSAASLICRMKSKLEAQISDHPLIKDVLGIVATLGKVDDANLSRISKRIFGLQKSEWTLVWPLCAEIFTRPLVHSARRLLSEYLGQETMLAVIVNNYEGVKALEAYNKDGSINKGLGIHTFAAAIGSPLDDRFVVICLESLRPYAGELIANDPQRRLDLVKPRLLTGETPPGFLGFAVNMVTIDNTNLYCTSKSGHSLRETLFYNLLLNLQVYRTREDMLKALSCITNGAISLDGGIVRSPGFFSLGHHRGDVDIKFPSGSEMSKLPDGYFEIENRMKETSWKKDRALEDIQREQSLLDHARFKYETVKREFVQFLAESSSYATQVIHHLRPISLSNGDFRAESPF
ncbi:hypothetical protein BUALT_Bualt06G0090900 [Buddleja alternifolia]|uniref:Cytidyltransferase-like domain-containing protein n=1 Tax=Buddleja alternifolia TaxID=168488 RepID=A0AAV6XQ07_9LAMI|nr:hypothetical protein BUALT_Bualt06G0090900 [Buddleja alternifolia]